MTQDINHVEELEERVGELEATVRGLTEELVDASERIRALEAELDTSPSTQELREAREEADVTPEGEATKSAEGEGSGDTDESDLDDIIVA